MRFKPKKCWCIQVLFYNCNYNINCHSCWYLWNIWSSEHMMYNGSCGILVLMCQTASTIAVQTEYEWEKHCLFSLTHIYNNPPVYFSLKMVLVLCTCIRLQWSQKNSLMMIPGGHGKWSLSSQLLATTDCILVLRSLLDYYFLLLCIINSVKLLQRVTYELPKMYQFCHVKWQRSQGKESINECVF